MSRLRPGSRRRMFSTLPEPPGPGDLVTVDHVWPAVPAYRGAEGHQYPAKDEELDGNEGPGVIEAVDGPLARVRLDDGRVLIGIKRSRLVRRAP